MKIELNFTDEEMILFLSKKYIFVEKEERLFDSSDMFLPESNLELKSVWIVTDTRYYPYPNDEKNIHKEIMVADEKSYQSKSSVLKETFVKELKKSLLKL